ncbi:MAG: aldehyde ferredoxin oxidoreductase N-terminal domain-containing protein [Candidatus Ranarchaeia archaeon]
MKTSNCWAGNYLFIDLSKGRISIRDSKKWVKTLIGGRGLTSRALYEFSEPNLDPFDPDVPICLGVGALVGTSFPGANKLNFSTKSAISEGWADSTIGGWFPPELKFAGYDFVIIKGKAEKPVYISIRDDDVKIKPSKSIWGKTTYEVWDELPELENDQKIRMLSIGPAGENKVRTANVLAQWSHSASSNGMGAVMGSKNLKAIAVRGTRGIQIANSDEFYDYTMKMREYAKDHPFWDAFNHRVGSENVAAMVWKRPITSYGIFRKKKFSQKEKDFAFGTAKGLMDIYAKANMGCFGCWVRCWDFIDVPDVGAQSVMPCTGQWVEPFHGMLMLDWKDNFKFNLLATKLGFNNKGTSSLIGWIIQMYEEGILTEKQLGFKPKYGDWDTTEQIMRKLIQREGIYNTLAEDIYRASYKLGDKAKKILIHTYKRVAPGMDFRGPMIFPYLINAISDTGEFKRQATVFEKLYKLNPKRTKKIVRDIFGNEDILDPKLEISTKHVPSMFIETVGLISDFTGVCYNLTRHFANSGPYGLVEISKALSLATGMDFNADLLYERSCSIRSLQKAYEIREGRNHLDDDFSARMYNEPQTYGPFKGKKLDPKIGATLRMNLYQAREWDRHTGVPLRKSLEKLGSEYEYIIKDMERIMEERKKMQDGIVSKYIPSEKAKFSVFKPVAPFYKVPKFNWIPIEEKNPMVDEEIGDPSEKSWGF